MNYNTSNGIKFKFKNSPSKKALDELNKKGVTVYDKMGNAVNSPVTTVKKTENSGNNTNLAPSVQGASKPTGISSLHDKIGDTIASAKKLVEEQINSKPYKDILPAPKKESKAEPVKSTKDPYKNAATPKKSIGYQIKDSITGQLYKKSPWSKSLFDKVDAYAIEKNIPAAQEAIDLNIKTGKLSKDDLPKYPYLRDGLAFSYAAGEVGNKKAERAARELAYTNVDLEDIMPAKWAEKPDWIPNDKRVFGMNKAYDNSDKTRYVSDNGVRFRSAPGLNSSIIDSMSKGESVKYTGNKTEKIDGYQWAEVEYGGKKGWVAADYLKISKPAYDTPSQQETNADSSLYEKAPEELFVKSQEKNVEKRTAYLNEKIPEWMADEKYFKKDDDLIDWYKEKGTKIRYTGSYCLPVPVNRINQAFYGRTSHAGKQGRYKNSGLCGAIDFQADSKTKAYAVLPGKIVYVPDTSNTDYNRVTIETNINGETYYLEYLHFGTILVSKNEKVEMGTPVGIVGNTGCEYVHLDFRVYQFKDDNKKIFESDGSKIFIDPFELFDFDVQFNYQTDNHDYH